MDNGLLQKALHAGVFWRKSSCIVRVDGRSSGLVQSQRESVEIVVLGAVERAYEIQEIILRHLYAQDAGGTTPASWVPRYGRWYLNGHTRCRR